MGTNDRAGFGRLLRATRQDQRLTQEKLAELSGLSVRTIRDLERGRVQVPQRRTAEILANALDLPGPARRRFLAAAGQPEPVPPGPARSAPAELPAAVAELVGRHHELSRLRMHAAGITAGTRPSAAVVSMHGPPGIGKTSLAVAAATELRPLFPDGQLFVDLRGHDRAPLEPTEVLTRFLRSLGVVEQSVPNSLTELTAVFRTLADQLRMLLVLDNAADEAQVRPLLPAGPRCLVLVTSRRPMVGLECLDRIAMDTLPTTAGCRLLNSVVGARVSAEPEAARELVKLCGGLPLAVRIAANRLAARPEWPVGHLVEQLRDERHRLSLLAAGDLGVRAAIDVSYRQLEPAAATLFRRAALIKGPDFDADLAAVVAGSNPAAARRSAEALVDAGLLATAGTRYRFHDLIHLYARERWAREPESARREASERMTSWLLARTAEAGAALDADTGSAAVGADTRAAARAWLEREAANWQAAIHDAAAYGLHRQVIAAVRAMHWYSDIATHRHPWAEMFRRGVDSARAVGSRSDEVVLLNFEGWALYLCEERYGDARAVLRRALRIAREIGDRREQGWALTYLAAIALRLGCPAKVLRLARPAARIFEKLDFVPGQWSAFTMLGSGLSELGRCDEALRIHQEVVQSFRRRRLRGEPVPEAGEAQTMLQIAQGLTKLGRYDEASEVYAAAHRLFTQCDSPWGAAVATYRLGLLRRDTGDPEAARASLTEAAAAFAGLGAISWEMRAQAALSTIESVGAASRRVT